MRLTRYFSVLIFFFSVNLLAQSNIADIYKVIPTKFQVLDGYTLPENPTILDTIHIRLAPGEFEPASLLIKPNTSLTNVTVEISSLSNGSQVIPADAIDPYIAKVWWQSSINSINVNGENDGVIWGEPGTEPDSLVQELLIKDDNLIRVTIPYNASVKNELRMKRTSDGNISYYNLSNRYHLMPGNDIGLGYQINDSQALLPFNLTNGLNKQLWFIFRVDENQTPGKYYGNIILSSNQGVIKNLVVELEVLPFNLLEPEIIYGIFYGGYLNVNNNDYGFTTGHKNAAQYQAELVDMYEHGIRYPSNINNRYTQDLVLNARNAAGLPSDRVYISSTHLPMNNYYNHELGVPGFESYTWDYILNYLNNFKSALNNNGFSNSSIYMIGRDETNGDELYTIQSLYYYLKHYADINIFQPISVRGGNIQGGLNNFNIIGQSLTQPVLVGENEEFTASEVQDAIEDWHSVNGEPLMYGAPQVAYENPEVYRKNYGLRLALENWGGAFEYAYAEEKGASIWNDWDYSETGWRGPYRDHAYVYPITGGVLSTVQWEGRREGYDDVRYYTTLKNYMNSSTNQNLKNQAQAFLSSLDYGFYAHPDMDAVREQIIDYILMFHGDTFPPVITSVQVDNQSTIKLNFSEPIIPSSAENSDNYIINPGVIILGASLSDNGMEVTLITSAHSDGQSYSVTVNNISDLYGNILLPPDNQINYVVMLPPEVTGAFTAESETVIINFSKLIERPGAQNPSSYNIDNGLIVYSASLDQGGDKVTLSTSPHQTNLLYNVVVQNVVDLHGNPISSDANSASYSYSESEVSVSVSDGWNIISIPLLAENMNVNNLFPTAVSPAYWYSNGYISETALSTRKGYMIKFNSAQEFQFSGDIVFNPIRLYPGWNLIGVLNRDVAISSTVTLPTGIIASSFYGYDHGYYVADTLKVGRGYWVKSTADGYLEFAGQSIGESVVMSSNDKNSSIIISDDDNNSFELLISDQNSAQFELPPLPPIQLFDARFGSNRYSENLLSQERIEIQSENYPVTIRAREISLDVQYVSQGQIIRTVLPAGEKIVLTDENIKEIDVSKIEIPVEYELSQNYPNPFNPSTKIKFGMPQKGYVKLTVFNLVGEELEVLVNEVMDPGYHVVDFTGADFASGVYLYRIEAGDFTSVRKMILLK